MESRPASTDWKSLNRRERSRPSMRWKSALPRVKSECTQSHASTVSTRMTTMGGAMPTMTRQSETTMTNTPRKLKKL